MGLEPVGRIRSVVRVGRRCALGVLLVTWVSIEGVWLALGRGLGLVEARG